MKRWFVTALLSVVALFASAQKYMRYHMNDGSFNGFYTDCVDSIVHTSEHTQVWTFGKCHEIPLANIDTITFEGVDLGMDADDMVGQYRIYEYEVSPTDSIYSVYKKAYFDNRALLMTSKTGEFGANDTIMLQSEYYDSRLLMITDERGNICQVFDGKNQMYIYYWEDGSSTVHLFNESSDKILATVDFPADIREKYSYTRGVGGQTFKKALQQFSKKFDDVKAWYKNFEYEHPAGAFFSELGISQGLVNGAERLSEVLTDIENDPTNRHKLLIIDGVQIVGDLAGIGLTIAGGALTGGALWAAVGAEIILLEQDMFDLLNHIAPVDTRQIQAYYEQKYGIMLYPHQATDIGETSATLNGVLYSADGVKGRIFFNLIKYLDDKVWHVDANVSSGNDNYQHFLSAKLENLDPDSEYAYMLYYDCYIKGVRFRFSSDTQNWIEFRTKEKSDEPTPGEAIDLGLSVKWASRNVGASSPEEYGGYYAWGETEEKSDYDWKTYKYYNDNHFVNIGSNISGTQYDVAHMKWGGSWRMPTLSEFEELINNCTWKWTTYNGVGGQLVTSPNGNSIFLPATGYRHWTELMGDCNGCYWSATMENHDSSTGTARTLHLTTGGGDLGHTYYLRFFGLTVRPVTE